MATIPKIIHQTWKSSDLPVNYKRLAETWKYFLPDWEYILWTDKMNREFVANYHPDFLSTYDRYPRNIQRADAIRYLLLKKYGGLYVDMDFECLENIEALISQAEFTAGKEPHRHARRFGIPYIICNALMASTPENEFINHVYDNLISYQLTGIDTSLEVLHSTGPFLLTRSYNEFPNKAQVCILEPETIYPIEINEVKQILNNTVPDEMADRINRAKAIHYFFSNW